MVITQLPIFVPTSWMAVTNGIKAARHVKLNVEMAHKHTYTVCGKYFL
jgi:hypothetical protein